MPELPEVQTVVDTLRPHVAGRRVVAFALRRPDYATPPGHDWSALAGSTVVDLRRRAKRVVFDLGEAGGFYAKLGMTGRFLWHADAGDPLEKHTHATLDFDHGQARLVDPRRFGGLVWGDGDARVGPEPLTMRSQQLADRLLRTRRPVKSALLDQQTVAGLGNIYADEALFAANIHPLTRGCDLDRPAVARLSRALKLTLTKAIAAGGSTIRDHVDASGTAGRAQESHRVYARAGLPCARCRSPIERVVLSSRSTHFCPACQPIG